MAWPVANPQFPPSLNDDEDELNLKVEFAGYLARGASPREAAYTVFRNDFDTAGRRYYGRALQAEQSWTADPIVREEVERQRIDIQTNPENEPSNSEIFLLLWETAKEAKVAGKFKEVTDAAKILLEARGVLKSGNQTNVNVDNRSVTYVAEEIPAAMTIEEWQAYSNAKRAQKKIANVV